MIILRLQITTYSTDRSDKSDKSESNTTLPVVPEARQKALPRQSPEIRSVIARLSGRFAREKRREHTQVCDRSGERRKARGSKRERSVNKKNGAFARARTVDPVIKSHLLYRLSYERTYCLSTLLNILLFSKNAS